MAHPVRRRFLNERVPLVLPSRFPVGLLGWQSAEYENYHDGDAVTALTNHLDGSSWGTQVTTTNQPTFRANGLNNKRAVQYATDDYLVGTAAQKGWSQNCPGMTWVSLLQMTLVPTSTNFLGPAWSAGNNGTNARWLVSAQSANHWTLGAVRPIDDGAGGVANSVLVVDTKPHVLHTTADFVTGYGRMWLDGVLIATSNAFPVVGLSTNLASVNVDHFSNPIGSSTGNALCRHQAFWNRAYHNTDLAPLIRSWCRDGGITYLGA